jgi:gliding motility-associated-like protein
MKRLLLSSILSFLSLWLTAQNNFINQDSVFAQSADCVGGVSVCIDSINYDNVADYRFTLNGTAYTGMTDACREDTIHTYSYFVIFQNSETGPFVLNSWVVNGKTYSIPSFNTLNQLVDSMRRWDPSGNWQLEPAAQIIYGFPSKGSTYNCQNITGLAKGGTNDVCYNVGFNFSGLKFRVPPGRHQFIVEEISSGLKDTVKVTAACVSKDTVRETMFIGTNRSYCVSSTELLGQPQLATFTNFCAKTTTNVSFDNLSTYCINYTGRAAGTDTACLRVCDQYGVCDTTILYITAEANARRFFHLFQDTITVGLNRQKCDAAIPSGTISSFINDCPTRSGREISFAFDAGTRCVTYTGLAVGADTACLIVCNTTGVCDTTHFYITGQSVVTPPQGGSHVFTDTITVGLNRQKCNLTIPTGTINVFQNLCATASGTNVNFALDLATRCVTYTGVTVGLDTACVRVCNTTGVCDTTTVIIQALAVVTPPPPTGGSHVFTDTITVGLNRQKCNLTIPTGTINVFQNLCATASSTNVNFVLDLATRCVTYTGVSVGKDTACVRVCNTSNVCDTTTMIIDARPLITTPNVVEIFKDTISVGIGLTRQKCNIKVPAGTISIFENFCNSSSGRNVTFGFDLATRCLTYTGLVPGEDTACVRVCNTTGVCDTTYLYIEAIPYVVPPPVRRHNFADTITVGANRQKCDVISPTGIVVVFENICQTSSGREITFTLDAATRCVNYRGIAVGFDTACVRVCNTEGVCDTTTFVIEGKPLPIQTTPNVQVFNDTITIGSNRQKCDLKAPVGATTIQNFSASSSGTKVRFAVDALTRCVTYTGVSVGADTACIRVCNPTNQCDTTYMIIQGKAATVVRPNLTPLTDTVKLRINERKTYCPDSLEFAGLLISEIKFCKTLNLQKSRVSLDNAKKCVVVTGSSVGTDTICVALCTANGFCDTTTLYIQVSADTLKPTPSIDTFTLKIGEFKVYCPDTTQLLSANISTIGSCSTATLDNTTRVLNSVTKCAEFRGVLAGKDTTCVVICNAGGLCDTTILYITVTADTVKPIASIERITLRLGQDSLFTNIDSTQIIGGIDELNDVCPGKNGSKARMVLNRQLKNVAIRGVGVGVDTMCLVACNKTSKLCDTTTVIVTVIDTIKLTGIQAFNDFDTTRLGRSITLQVYKNDSLNRVKPAYLAILRLPLKGLADTISFRDGLIKYTAGRTPQSCGLDSFTYQVCLDAAKTACSVATVIIDVKCANDLKVFNAISPNGDGRNDALYFDGLQNYPDNTLTIYNRWGNQVLNVKNYQNDWQGTWNGSDLPDGTYFYLLKDEKTGELLKTGNLQIIR